MTNDKILELIQNTRDYYADGRLDNASEAETRATLIDPLLQALGWSFDARAVRLEHTMSLRNTKHRVDYALFPNEHDQTPSVIIEAKRPGALGDAAVYQTLFYCFQDGVRFAVLTDGFKWHFYLPAQAGKIEERQVLALTLAKGDAQEAAKDLRRFLARDQVAAGKHIIEAEKEYNSAARQRAIEFTLPKAWAEITSEPDDGLTALLAKRTGDLCEHEPDTATAAAFLRKLFSSASFPAPSSPAQPSQAASAPTQSDPSVGKVSVHAWTLQGVYYKGGDSADSAYEPLLKAMHEKFGDAAFKQAANHPEESLGQNGADIALQKEQVLTEGRPPFEVGGLWFRTNTFHVFKRRFLKRLCDIACIPFNDPQGLLLSGGSTAWHQDEATHNSLHAWTLQGIRGTGKRTATAAYEAILKAMYEKFGGDAFFQKVADHLEKNRLVRKLIMTQQRELMIRNENVCKIGGWWFGTGMSTSDKRQRLAWVCEVAGTPFNDSKGLLLHGGPETWRQG